MQVVVIGTGYVGLVAGACLAEMGHRVTCIDRDQAKIDSLRDGKVPFFEPRLEDLVKSNQTKGRLQFKTSLKGTLGGVGVIFIAVGTPPAADGSADLSAVLSVAEEVGRNLEGPAVVATKSTVPIGTGDQIEDRIRKVTDYSVSVVSNPEFMKEGGAVEDFMKPDRIIVGTTDKAAQAVMQDLYAPFQRTSNRIICMDRRSAEMTKYVANAMLATRISFMNEMADLAERYGADITNVRAGVGSDPRIGRSFLFPGVGFGGSCFPKDIQALLAMGTQASAELKVLSAVKEVNDAQPQVLVNKLVAALGEDLSQKRFAVWGLAFKPETDDMREAPSIAIINNLLSRGAQICASDPQAMGVAKKIWGDRIQLHSDPYDALPGADALLLVTEWNEFRRPNFDRVRSLLKQAYVFDGRNIYDPAKMKDMGFVYDCIGRLKSHG